jgi:F-type H+-transporting ATPase subunit b
MPRLPTLRMGSLTGALSLGAALSLAAAEAHAEGMPQLDFANPLTLSQVVWGAIIFLAFYLALSRWALPEVAEGLEARATSIAADLDAARKAKSESDAAVAELTASTREAHAAAQAQIASAVEAAKARAAETTAAADARLEAQIADAEQRIAAARSAALGALEQVAVDAAQDVVARLTGSTIDHGAVPAAVTAELAARRLRAA